MKEYQCDLEAMVRRLFNRQPGVDHLVPVKREEALIAIAERLEKLVEVIENGMCNMQKQDNT